MLQRKCVGLTWKSKVTGNFGDIFKAQQKPSSPGFSLPLLKSAWDLVYPRPNREVRDISRNLIGCLEDWELEKTCKPQKIQTPYWLEMIPVCKVFLVFLMDLSVRI